jgi:hypothetical protein
MTVSSAWQDGLRRVVRARILLLGLWLASVMAVLPFALAIREALVDHLGESLAAESAAAGVNFDWWSEFLAHASGLSQTFVPSILGFAPVLKNIGTIADGASLAGPVALIVAANTLLSLFLLGGMLDRLARDRSTSAHGFFAACGVFFFRFLRLAALAAAVYGALFWWVYPSLFDEIYPEWTRQMTSERQAFALRLALSAAFAALLIAVNLIFDYAKIRMVVEDRRSAIGTLAAASRFVRRHRGAAFALYLLNTLLFIAVLALYYVVAPGAGGGISAWLALFVSQIYIVARIAVRLAFAASQIALFQGRLAHAGYVARPVDRWPDSPAAAALRE